MPPGVAQCLMHCPWSDDSQVENVGWFAAAMAIIFLINLSPGFMPSSWMVMAFFYIQFGLPLVPLCIAGAIVSGLAPGVKQQYPREHAQASREASSLEPRFVDGRLAGGKRAGSRCRGAG